VDIDKVNKITGLDITFVTTADTNEEAFELLKNWECHSGMSKDQQ
jgi:large subunit ribosomal protein L5